MKAMNDFVFVRKVKVERVSSGGIILGEQEYDEGEVVSVGPGKINSKTGFRESMWGLKPGMQISFSPNGNWKQKVNDEDLIVIRRDSVIGEVRP